MTYKKGQIVYCQGIWKCRVVRDYGSSIDYIPLEGYAPDQKGQTFAAEKSLFNPRKKK